MTGSSYVTNENLADMIYLVFLIGLVYLIAYFVIYLIVSIAGKLSGSYLTKVIKKELKKFPFSIWLSLILLTVTQIPDLKSSLPLTMKFISIASAIILFVLVGSFINKIIKKYFNHKARKTEDEQKAHFYKYISHIVIAGIWFSCFVIVLGLAGVDINGFFAFLGFTSLGLSFALRNTIKDGLNSFIIVFQKPFAVGDYINNVENYGKVTEVGLKNTQLKTIDNKTVIIPNSSLMDKPVTNFRDRENIKMKYELSVNTPKLGRYERKIGKIRNKIYTSSDLIEKNSVEIISKSISKEKHLYDISIILDLEERDTLDEVNRDLMHNIFNAFKDQNMDIEEIVLNEKPSPFAR